VGLVLLLFVGGFVALIILDSRQRAASSPPGGVEEFGEQARGHTEADVDYEQSPPVGGEHHPIWQNCGFYNEPVRDEHAVHSLEHGAIWITYQPDLPQEQIDRLRETAESQTYILVSPYEGLQSPVVASAWGYQVELDSAEDEDLERFIRAYRQGPQTPEPGAACTGGVGEPAATA
jgi:hypothetical protein